MYTKLLNNLEQLKLDKMRSYLPAYLDMAAKQEVGLVDALLHLTSQEIHHKESQAAIMQVKMAGYPFHKSIADYDFSFQSCVSKPQVLDFMTLRFMEQKENIIFYGTPGVGKTHLATAIGIEASTKHYQTYFISCNDLIQNLKKAHAENRLEIRLKHYAKYRLLVVDEIGYLPIDGHGANLFFQLIAKRYERHSTIITTNQPFSKWGEVFADSVIANAILDRLLHHSHVIKIVGPSYRTKDVYEAMKELKSDSPANS
jgi:DNA replication protein DnaC